MAKQSKAKGSVFKREAVVRDNLAWVDLTVPCSMLVPPFPTAKRLGRAEYRMRFE